jgi:hypothetical protein
MSDFTLFLSRTGDSVKISKYAMPEEELPPPTPLQEKAATCKTHEQVLAFLEEINSSEELKNSLEFYHSNNRSFNQHFDFKGRAHPCDLEKQIDFVKLQVIEKQIKELQIELEKLKKEHGAVTGWSWNSPFSKSKKD